MYLLDTNHCSRLVEGQPTITKRIEELEDALVGIPAIVRGELMFMAHKSDMKTDNLRLFRDFLADIHIYPIDEGVADIYGWIKGALLDYFGPREKARRRKAKVEKLGFSENDLWIAATAKYHELVIVSADTDFNRMRQAVDLSLERWWTPDQKR